MRPFSGIAYLFILAMSWQANSLVEVSNGKRKIVYDSSTFKYYGPRNFDVSPTLAVYLDGEKICSAKHGSVLGKVVITKFTNTCSRERHYQILSKAGAIALIVSTEKLIGLKTFSHSSFNVQKYSGHSMGFLNIRNFAQNNWNDSKDLMVTIYLPHNSQFDDIFTSWIWTLLFRIFIPLISVWTAVINFGEIMRQKKPRCQKDHCWYAVCSTFIIVVVMLVVAALLALGHHGPHVLPLEFHNVLTTSLMGLQDFASFVIVIVFDDKLLLAERMLSGELHSSTSFLKDHRNALAIGLFFTFGLDVMVALAYSFQGFAEEISGGNVRSCTLILGSGYCFLFIYNILTAFKQADKIASYTSRSHPLPTCVKLKYVAFWLCWSARMDVLKLSALVSYLCSILVEFDDSRNTILPYLSSLFLFFLYFSRVVKCIIHAQMMKGRTQCLRCPIAYVALAVNKLMIQHPKLYDRGGTFPSFHESRDSFFFDNNDEVDERSIDVCHGMEQAVEISRPSLREEYDSSAVENIEQIGVKDNARQS